MVESFASGITNGGFSEGDTEETYVDLLLDHQLGPGRVKALTYCDELEVFSLGMADGTIISYHLQVELDKDDDDYGDES
jgi:hypothetical protein